MSGSMTGWGKYNTKEFNVAIRGLNSKYKEIFLHLPQELFEAEPHIYKIANERITRGRVDIYVNFNLEQVRKKFIINDLFFKDVYERLNKLYKRFNIKKDIPVEYILKDVEGVVTTRIGSSKMTVEKVKKAVSHALDDFKKSKRTEGLRLIKDIKNNVIKIEKLINDLKLQFSFLRESFAEKTRQKIQELIKEEQNKKFLDLNIVEILEKYDINEEIVRIGSHTNQIMSMLRMDCSGRKLDFYAQEIYREANTINSKIQDSKIIEITIGIKELAEKIREQAQNLE